MRVSLSKLRSNGLGRMAFLSLAIMLVAALGCEGGCGCDGGAGAEASTQRVEQMAQHLPQDAPFSFVVGDLAGMRDSLKTARDTIGDAVPTDLIQEQAKNELGIDPFDAESFKKSGIDENGAMMMGLAGTRAVLLTYVSDKQKFEKTFSDQLKKSMELEGMVKAEKVDGQDVKVLGTGDQTVAWAYGDKLVAVVFPASEGLSDVTADTEAKEAKQVAANLIKLDKAKSLASTEAFKKFNNALASTDSMALFINAKTKMAEEGMAALERSGDAVSRMAAPWLKENVDAFGLSMHVENNSMKFRGWAALPKEVSKRAQEIMTAPAENPVDNFATANTLLGLRVSVDMDKLWAFYKETLPKEDREKLMADFQKNAEQLGIDIEKDVINKLTGNFGIIFYGIDQQMLEQAGGNILAAVGSNPSKFISMMAPVQFEDQKSLDKVVNALNESADGAATRTKVEGNVEVLKMQNVTRPRGQLFLQENLLVYATNAFSDQDVYQYMTGKSKEGALGDDDKFNLGKEFATAKNYDGLYVNFNRLQDQLGSVLAQLQPAAVEYLAKAEEASLSTEVTDNGAVVNLTVDLTPQAEADKPAGEENKENNENN